MYPQHRMVHLMDIIAHATTRFIQSKMSGMDLWRSNYNQEWLPDGYSQTFRLYVFGPSGLKEYGSATLRYKI